MASSKLTSRARAALGDHPRIGAVDAVDVRPDLQELGVHGPGGDGAGVVRAAAAEEVHAAVGVAAEEAGQHGHGRGALAQGREGLAGGGPVDRRGERGPGGADERLGIEQAGVEPAGLEEAVDQGAGGPLAQGGVEGEGARRLLQEQGEAASRFAISCSRAPRSTSASMALTGPSSPRRSARMSRWTE